VKSLGYESERPREDRLGVTQLLWGGKVGWKYPTKKMWTWEKLPLSGKTTRKKNCRMRKPKEFGLFGKPSIFLQRGSLTPMTENWGNEPYTGWKMALGPGREREGMGKVPRRKEWAIWGGIFPPLKKGRRGNSNWKVKEII